MNQSTISSTAGATGTAGGGAHEERERHAFNLAFSELELDWHWDEQTYSALRALPGESDRVRSYLHTRHGHLLKAYDEEFLVDAIRRTKSRCWASGL